MTHDDAFLQAILEAPDDDTPRLIYADWLDEHGDPARAEFIRLQYQIEETLLDNPYQFVIPTRRHVMTPPAAITPELVPTSSAPRRGRSTRSQLGADSGYVSHLLPRSGACRHELFDDGGGEFRSSYGTST